MTRKILPPCSVPDCDHAAGAIINGALYCGAHASDKLKTMQILGRTPGPKPAAA
ncbi:hypothetical protein V6R86_02160 [Sphingomonas kaistensis]|uniref:Uncharacterized protein n=1 Tax=Sphingomonas kaistensis TaxID=298708 RepID=A0ABZ2FZH5_9SPHN